MAAHAAAAITLLYPWHLYVYVLTTYLGIWQSLGAGACLDGGAMCKVRILLVCQHQAVAVGAGACTPVWRALRSALRHLAGDVSRAHEPGHLRTRAARPLARLSVRWRGAPGCYRQHFDFVLQNSRWHTAATRSGAAVAVYRNNTNDSGGTPPAEPHPRVRAAERCLAQNSAQRLGG